MLNLAAIEALLQNFVHPSLSYEGARAGKTLTNVHATSGTDLARGPWIKFSFEEDRSPRSVQGYFLFAGGQRIKLDGNIEVEADHIALHLNFPALVAEFSGSRGLNGKVYPFDYVFTATVGA